MFFFPDMLQPIFFYVVFMLFDVTEPVFLVLSYIFFFDVVSHFFVVAFIFLDVVFNVALHILLMLRFLYPLVYSFVCCNMGVVRKHIEQREPGVGSILFCV